LECTFNLKNKEKHRKANQKNRKANRERYNFYGRTHKARKRGAKGSHTLQEWKELKILLSNHCLGCWKRYIRLTEDHIIPLSKNGTDLIDNIQPLCKSCNSQKHAKYDVPKLFKN